MGTWDQGPAGTDDTFTGDGANETADGLGGNDTINGNGGDDTLIGGVGFDTLNGGDGNDTLTGGSDPDTINGGVGDDIMDGGVGAGDTLTYADASSAVHVSLFVTSAQDTIGSGFDTIAGFEILIGSNFSDTLTGSNLAEQILGGLLDDVINGDVGTGDDGGDDDIHGGDGNDTLNGGPGADYVAGEGGNDTISVWGCELPHISTEILDGGTGFDTLVVNGLNPGIGTAQDYVNFTDATDIRGFERLTFGATYTNKLTAIFHGAAIMDTSKLSATLQVVGSSAKDTLNITFGSPPYPRTTDIDLHNWTFVGWGAADKVLIDAGGRTVTGSVSNDTILGGRTINAWDGDDIIYCEEFGQTMSINGGAGVDTVSFANAVAGETVSLAISGPQTIRAGGPIQLTLSNVENLTGSSHDDQLTGSKTANTLSGGAGNDVLSGGKGADVLNGVTGRDTLNGGIGHDTLTGGGGRDDFIFNAAAVSANSDTITDFTHGSDKIQLENSVFTALGATTGALAAAKFWVGANAHDANDRVVYNPSNGLLFYDADGDGAGAKVLVAKLDAGLTLTASDVLVI